MVLGGALGPALSPVTPGAPPLCVAGVALGERRATLRGRRGTW